jgi:HEAT repeat protein
MRALEMTQFMEAADEVFDRLAQMVYDPDVGVRAEAVAALGYCQREEAIPLLYDVDNDTNRLVREAANRSIDQIADRSLNMTNTERPDLGGYIG